MSNEYQENNYTKIDLTRSYDKNISSLKRMIVHLPWWSHFFTILIILYCCERVYAKLSSISRESSYRLEQRRRYGIPDSDKRAFKQALAAANASRRQRVKSIQAEEERQRLDEKEESSQWRMLGRSTGWSPHPSRYSPPALPGAYEESYEPVKYDYIPSTSSIYDSNNEELPSLFEKDVESDRSIILDDLDSSNKHLGKVNQRTRKRSMDESSQIDQDNLIKRRRATSISTTPSNISMNEESVDNDYSDDNESRMSTTPQNENRGRKRSFDDTSEISVTRTRHKKAPKNSEEWTDMSGTTYKYENGVKKRLETIKEWRSKYNMPKDSQHPDRDIKLRVYVEKWITDDDYEVLLRNNELGWQPDEDELSSVNESSIYNPDEEVSQQSSNKLSSTNSRKSSSVYYMTRTPIKRHISNRSNGVSSITSSPPPLNDSTLQSTSRLRVNKKKKSDLSLSTNFGDAEKEKRKEADLLKEIRNEKHIKKEKDQEEKQRREGEAHKTIKKTYSEGLAGKEVKTTTNSTSTTPTFDLGSQTSTDDKVPTNNGVMGVMSNTDAKTDNKKMNLPSFSFGSTASSKDDTKPTTSSNIPKPGGFSFNLGK